MNYSYAQLEQLWIDAGGPKAVAPLMAAIALAESSGSATVVNSIGACGLWQIHPYEAGCTNAASNAKMAVGKYQTQGLGAWVTYTTGAYKQYYKGGVAPSSLPQGGTGGTTGTGTGGVTSAADAAFVQAFGLANTPGLSLDPIHEIGNAWQAIVSIFSGGASTADSVAGILKAITEIGPKVDELFHAFLWFLYPSHWVRIFCVAFGLVLLVPGFYGLMHTGTGDMYLAVGIMLVTLAGVLFFFGFHNVPEDIQNMHGFLGWIAEGVRTGSLPAGSGQPPVSGFGTPATNPATTS